MRCNPTAVSYGTRSNPQYILFTFVLFSSTYCKHCSARESTKDWGTLGLRGRGGRGCGRLGRCASGGLRRAPESGARGARPAQNCGQINAIQLLTREQPRADRRQVIRRDLRAQIRAVSVAITDKNYRTPNSNKLRSLCRYCN